jgi:hypothetical protein
MSKPNKTAGRIFAKMGRDPNVTEAINARHEQSPTYKAISAFQKGEISADEFKSIIERETGYSAASNFTEKAQ